MLAGPENGKPLVLLHGFPEFWYSWRKQIDHFAQAGYRVIIPDQRGYNLSDKPGRVADYSIDKLGADIIGLLDALGYRKAFVAGHDWGAAVTWWIAARYPDRLEKVAILNVPHSLVMKRALVRNRAQQRRSWYIFLFQTPWLPEWRLSANHFALGERSLRGSSRPGTFTDADLAQYRQAWSQPGALRGMIHWYRAALRKAPKVKREQARVKIPLLLIWGAKDKFLGRELIQPSLELCDQGRLELIEEATHWVHHEEPARVNRVLTEFFGAP
jgi:pimeloyl-ACP methyl ester carboxylesterase